MKKRSYSRTKAQQDYADRHPNCEICGRKTEHIHHISRNRNDDSDENLWASCFEHHTGSRGIHGASEVAWIATHLLSRHPKWESRYQRLKSKADSRRLYGEEG